MKKTIIYLIFTAVSFCSFSQYDLSDTELADGFLYLKKNAGFKNPSSVKLNEVKVSTFKFVKECFTWARYDISAQNGFGGYVRSEFYVWFFEGKPFWTQESGGEYPATPYYANSDEAANHLIELATQDYLGIPILKSKYCPGEEDKIKAAELVKQEQKMKIENDKRDLDIETTKKIISFLYENNVSDARANLNLLNFPKDFPIEYKKTLEFKEDSLNILKINSFIISNKIEDAASLYSKLNSQNSELKNEIQKLLEHKFNTDTLNISQDIFSQILNANKDNFLKLQEGSYFLFIDKNGRVSIKGNSLNLNQPSNSVGGYRQFERFDKIYCFSKLKMNVSTRKIVVPNSKKILVGTKKEIKVNSKGKYYIANYLNSSQFHKSIDCYYEDDVKKNKYQITQDLDMIYSANDINIGTKEMYEVLEEGRLSKRMPIVITKLSSISIFVFFGGLRIYEFFKIP